MAVNVKRIYDEPSKDDGYRVLVDRLWPRGVSKDKAQLDEWAKDLAPSDELRRDFHGHPDKFEQFRTAYAAELDDHADAVDHLRQRAASGTVTLLFAAKDTDHNNAQVLADILNSAQ